MILRRVLFVLTTAGLLVAWRTGPEWLLFQACTVAILAAAVAGWALQRFTVKWSWALLPVLAIPLWPAAQLAFGVTVYRHATLLELLRWNTYAAVFVLAFWSFRRRAEINWLLRGLIIFSLVLAAEATMQHFAGNGKMFWLFTARYVDGAMGPFINRDHYASFMALILLMAILRAFDEPTRRWTYVLAAAAIYASVIAGASRAGSLLVTAEVLLCLFLITIRPTAQGMPAWHRHRFTLATLFLVAALVAVVGWQPLYDRFMLPDPYQGRRELAISTLAMIRDRPLTGFGAGTWTTVYPAYAIFDFGRFANAAHNDWLQWAADGGIPFAAVFFALFCISLAIAWRVPWAIGIAAVFIHSTIDFPIEGGRYQPAILFLIFGAALGRWQTVIRTSPSTLAEIEVPLRRPCPRPSPTDALAGNRGFHQRLPTQAWPR